MTKRAVMANTATEATKLSTDELDRQIAVARWRLGAATKATLREMARKRLAMLEMVKAERQADQ